MMLEENFRITLDESDMNPFDLWLQNASLAGFFEAEYAAGMASLADAGLADEVTQILKDGWQGSAEQKTGVLTAVKASVMMVHMISYWKR